MAIFQALLSNICVLKHVVSISAVSYIYIYFLVGDFNPSEKYESQLGWIIPNCFWTVIQNSMVPVTTNQIYTPLKSH